MASRGWFRALLMPRFVERMSEGDHGVVRVMGAVVWGNVLARFVVAPTYEAYLRYERREAIAKLKAGLKEQEKMKADIVDLQKWPAEMKDFDPVELDKWAAEIKALDPEKWAAEMKDFE